METRILLVDDEPLLLESLEMILATIPDFSVVGSATDGAAALRLLEHAEADLALIDLNMVGMGGLQLIRELRHTRPTMKLLVLTTFYDEKNIVQAVQYGADGYLLKDAGRKALVEGIQSVMRGQSILDAKVMAALSRYMTKSGAGSLEQPAWMEELTGREAEICRRIARGCTNAEIARELFISEGTVKNYISAIYDKSGIRDRAALAVALAKARL